MKIPFTEQVQMMKEIIKNTDIEKDIRLTIALELLYQYEISLGEFKNILQELGCYDGNRRIADKKTNAYWDKLLDR